MSNMKCQDTEHSLGLGRLCVPVLRSSVLSDSVQPYERSPPGPSVHGDSPDKNTGAGCHFLLQGILPTGMEPTSLVSCIDRQVLYHSRHLGRPGIFKETLQVMPSY